MNKRQICITSTLPHQNQYTLALNGEYSSVAFDEVRAPENKGHWRSHVFKSNNDKPMDLEIGTGNGLYFAHYAHSHPQRLLVGIELKYKPLIQSIRRARQMGCNNVAIARYHAFHIDDIFATEELNDVFIYFPDPWVSPRKPKNRTVNKNFLTQLYGMQRPGSKIDFKTDSLEYFLWAIDEIKQTTYTIEFQTLDLHNSELAHENYITQFERIFTRQGIKTNFVRLRKPS